MSTHESQVNRLLSTMTPEQKAGQVMLVGLDPTATGARYTALTTEMAEQVAALHLGGVVYFERNVGAPDELARLSADLQRTASDNGAPGLIVSIDQEGGRVVRMREKRGYTEAPSAMALGATGDPANARAIAALLAGEMRACGINMDLAPVVDVNNNARNPVIGTRSFGADPQAVAECGVAFIEGLQSGGVMAVAKHFPGKGDTGVDSHFALPTVPHPRGRLEAVEFVPFLAAMRAGVTGIMSSHVCFPAIEPTEGLAGTLSPRVMTGLIRGEMGYDGLLLTDSLEMGALATSGYPVPRAAVAALRAGADLLCISHGFELHREVHAALMQAVRDGVVAQERLDAAVRRILAAKQRHGLLDPGRRVEPGSTTGVGAPGSLEFTRKVAAQAVTLVRDRAPLLPLRVAMPLFVVEFARLGDPASGLSEPVFVPRLTAAFGGEGVVFHDQIGGEEIASLAARCEGKTVVVATSDAGRHPWQAELVRALCAGGAPVIAIAASGPYDLAWYPEVGTYLATYGQNPPTMDALLAVLAGRAPARGNLPVQLPAEGEVWP
jgi:beta-N-acetylhexosaminidase